MKKGFLVLLALLLTNCLFAVKLADVPELKLPGFIQVEGDDLFVVERSSYALHVYSLKTYKLKFILGKRGEGPGEFKGRPKLREVTPGHILISGGDRHIWYSRDGEIIKEKSLRKVRRLTPLKDNYAVQDNVFQGREVLKAVYLLNSKFERIKPLHQLKADVNRTFSNDPSTTEYRMLNHFFGFWCYDGKVFIADSQKGFHIDVFDSDGEHLYTIDKTKEIDPVKVDDDYKQRALDFFKIARKETWNRFQKSSFTFYKYFPPMRDFWIDSNKIYVTTYRVKDKKNEFIVLDLKGNILGRIFFPLKSLKGYKVVGEFDTYTIHNGTIYELFENDETDLWELHKSELPDLEK